MSHRPVSIGPENFALWTGRIELDPSIDTIDLQTIVTDYVVRSGITVVGYHTPETAEFTMLRWPDGRANYHTATPEECDIALSALANSLSSRRFQSGIVPDNKIHAMIGRKMGGYGEGEVASIETMQAYLADCRITDGWMISARATITGVESYGIEEGEKVGIIVADPSYEQAVHDLADMLEQHHYAIERGGSEGQPGTTTFWETRWSPTYGRIV